MFLLTVSNKTSDRLKVLKKNTINTIFKFEITPFVRI